MDRKAASGKKEDDKDDEDDIWNKYLQVMF